LVKEAPDRATFDQEAGTVMLHFLAQARAR